MLGILRVEPNMAEIAVREFEYTRGDVVVQIESDRPVRHLSVNLTFKTIRGKIGETGWLTPGSDSQL